MIARNYTISTGPRYRKLCESTRPPFNCRYCKVLVEHPSPMQVDTCGSDKCKKKRKQEKDSKRRKLGR